MGKYRKKPVVIEAIQFDGTLLSATSIMQTYGSMPPIGTQGSEVAGTLKLVIYTLEGVMAADAGDWIIQGVKGELYPCKPDIFEATYEAVEGGENDER